MSREGPYLPTPRQETLDQQTLSYEELRRLDLQYLWHPYTEISSFEQMKFPIVESAQGCRLHELDGRVLLDGISSWWCVNLGHSHPRLVRAIQEQAAKLQHTLL